MEALKAYWMEIRYGSVITAKEIFVLIYPLVCPGSLKRASSQEYRQIPGMEPNPRGRYRKVETL